MSATLLTAGINPMVPQGTLNRLISSIVVVNYPQLNITAPYLGSPGITISWDGETTRMFPTMTGTVQSPEPYQMGTASAVLLKSQNLAQLWETQRLTASYLGNVKVTTDATTLGAYTFYNCALQSVSPLKLDGTDVAYSIVIKGYYPINSNLWSLT